MRRLLLVGVAVISIYLAGCVAPETLYRADPISQNTVWYSGLEFQTQTKDSVTASVAFENELQGQMTFYVVVGNMGSKPVLVSPEGFRYTGDFVSLVTGINYHTMEMYFDTLSETDTVYAINPERELTKLDQAAAQANATYTNNTGLNAAAGLLQLVGSVATIGEKKTREEQKAEDRSARQIRESQMENEENYAGQMSSLAAQREYWQNAALRKTTLFQGSAVGGKVRFNVVRSGGTLNMVIPVDSSAFEFKFIQTPVPPQ